MSSRKGKKWTELSLVLCFSLISNLFTHLRITPQCFESQLSQFPVEARTVSVAQGVETEPTYAWVLAVSAGHSQLSRVYVAGIVSHSGKGWLFWSSPSSSRESKQKCVQNNINTRWVLHAAGTAAANSSQVWPQKNVGPKLPDLLIFFSPKSINVDYSSNF